MKIFNNWYYPNTEEHFVKYFKRTNFTEYQKEQRMTSFKFLDNNRTAIDIGANVGLWAKDICKNFNEVKLFEPYKPNIECLRKNLENFKNFQIFEYALSNINGYRELYIDEKGLGNNTVSPNILMKNFNKKEQIYLKKLDEFQFESVDYIKIDTQFHELEVIEGSIDTLKNNNPVICVESSRRNEKELTYVKKFSEILENLNYKIVGGVGKELFFKK